MALLNKLATPAMAEEYLTKQRPDLERRCRAYVAVEEIVDRENIAPSEEEVEADLKAAMVDMKANNMDLDEETMRGQILDQLRKLKCLEWLASQAKVTIHPL